MAILKYWQLALGALLSVFIAFGVHKYDSAVAARRQALAVAAQLEADVKTCNADKAITKEANDALQKDRDTIAKRLAALKLQHPASCVPIPGHAIALDSGGEHAGQNGISSDWLRDYAAECEGYRSEVIDLQAFLRKERK